MRASALAILAALALQPSSAPQPLSFVRSIALPHVAGRIDHLAYDAATRRLFVAALGNNTVEVIDVDANAHLTSLTGFREPQGIAAAADAHLVAIANGQGEGIQFIDAALKKARTVA